MKADGVIGCRSCGKPALLVGDEYPTEFPLCFWCMAEKRPGAAQMFLRDDALKHCRVTGTSDLHLPLLNEESLRQFINDAVAKERERVLREIEAYCFPSVDTPVTASVVRAAIHLARMSK